MSSVRKRVSAAVIGAVAVVGVLAPAATAAAEPATRSAPKAAASAQAESVKLDVVTATLNISNRIFDIVVQAIEQNQNRSGYVKSLVEGAFYDADQAHNVMVIKADHPYTTENLENVVYDATVHGDGYPSFRVLVFDSGVITNEGDGGYINWAFRGWFDRSDMTVTFHQP